MAVDLKPYDYPQVLRSVFEVDDNCLRVKIVGDGGGGGALEVIIDHTEDSIRLGDGTNFISSTTVGPKNGLDVNVINNPINVVVSNEVEITNDVGNPIPVNGTVTANIGTLNGVATEANQTTTNTKLDSLLTELQQKTEPTDTQPVSIASLPLPSGASTSALQTSGNASLTSIDNKLTSPLSVTGPLTDTELRASAVLISGTVTSNIGTTNGLALDTSVNTLLKPASTLNAVTTVGSITNTVVIKADTLVNQTNALKVDGSAVTQPVSISTLPLPTGASTSALQTTANASLSSIDTKLTSPLSIRDLVFATDKVDVSNSTVSLSSSTLTALENVTVDDITDDTTRELGRVLSSDILYTSETFNTTSNVLAQARPVNGNLNIRNYKNKTIFVKNTSVNNGRYSILASVDNGANYDISIVNDVALNAGITAITNTEIAYTHLQITARSQTNLQATSFVTKAYAQGT